MNNEIDPIFQDLDFIFVLDDNLVKKPSKWRQYKTYGLELHVLYETQNTERNSGGEKKARRRN